MDVLLTYKLGGDETLRYLMLTTPDPAATLARLQELHAQIQASGRPDYMREITLQESPTSSTPKA